MQDYIRRLEKIAKKSPKMEKATGFSTNASIHSRARPAQRDACTHQGWVAEAFALAQWRGPWMGWDALVAHAAKGWPALEPDFAPKQSV